MMTKTDQMLALLKAGDTKGALRIATTFRIGLTPEQKKALGTGYECLLRPYIYRQMGRNPTAPVQQAEALLHSIYADKL